MVRSSVFLKTEKKKVFSQMALSSESRKAESKLLNSLMAKKISSTQMAPESESSQMEESAKRTQMDAQKQKPGDLVRLMLVTKIKLLRFFVRSNYAQKGTGESARKNLMWSQGTPSGILSQAKHTPWNLRLGCCFASRGLLNSSLTQSCWRAP